MTAVSEVMLVAAFLGGLVSFLAPCVLPLVPALLSLVTGLDVAEVTAGTHRHLLRISRDTLVFAAGFCAVFVRWGCRRWQDATRGVGLEDLIFLG